MRARGPHSLNTCSTLLPAMSCSCTLQSTTPSAARAGLGDASRVTSSEALSSGTLSLSRELRPTQPLHFSSHTPSLASLRSSCLPASLAIHNNRSFALLDSTPRTPPFPLFTFWSSFKTSSAFLARPPPATFENTLHSQRPRLQRAWE